LTALLSGVRIQEVKPLASMPFIITSFNKDQRNINSKFARVAYGPNTSAEQKLSAFKDNILDSFYSQKQLYQTYIDAQELGVDEDDLNEMLLDRLKNREQVGALMEGEFKTPNFSSAAFRAQINRLERENPAAAAQFEDSVETVMELFTDMKDEVRGFDLNDSLDSLELTIDQLLSPSVPEIRRMPQRLQVFEQEQTPSLPTGITGQSVNQQVISNQNLGQRFLSNLTTQLSPQEKRTFLFRS